MRHKGKGRQTDNSDNVYSTFINDSVTFYFVSVIAILTAIWLRMCLFVSVSAVNSVDGNNTLHQYQ